MYSKITYNHCRGDIRFIARKALNQAKKRAKIKNIQFNLTLADLVEIYPKNNICPALGIVMQPQQNKTGDASPTLDRIDSRLGYIKNNVAFISNRANTIKSNATVEEVEKVAIYMKKIQSKNKSRA